MSEHSNDLGQLTRPHPKPEPTPPNETEKRPEDPPGHEVPPPGLVGNSEGPAPAGPSSACILNPSVSAPTSIHDRIRSITSILSTLIALCGVIFAAGQLIKVSESIKSAQDRDVQMATIKAVENWQLNTTLIDARKRISAAVDSNQDQSDYRIIQGNNTLRRDVLDSMNYLELMATGIKQGVYNKDLFMAHFERQITRNVPILLYGLPPSRSPEHANIKVAYCVYPVDDFPDLKEIFLSLDKTGEWGKTKPREKPNADSAKNEPVITK